ncbi:hypothetical protein A7982_14014 [Minicystis rosea]|nr:hypothetical protein A7982_14014 [Minicystis rosea]
MQLSLCKKNNVGVALEIARTARGILDGTASCSTTRSSATC